jgi:Zn-dependent peptidase ImmA (M78 family)/transcriptional regulator with XRE-family HTH domain
MSITKDQRIGLRIQTRRDALELSQQDLSARLGFKDRQILSSIENGDRRVTAAELARVAEVLDVEVDYFTDPFRLDGEGLFSFRANNVDESVLSEFQAQAGRWVATYRELRAEAGIEANFLGQKLNVFKNDSYETAQSAAAHLRDAWRLGRIPSATLEEAIRREIGALVLYVDAPEGISGAATYLPGLHSIIINRRETRGRRAFDLAHELFHLLTWDAIPPLRVEDPSTASKRVEQLADNFAAALLMPEDVVSEMWNARSDDDTHDAINRVATALGVIAKALKWRLHRLKLITRAEFDALDDDRLVLNGDSSERALPALFSSDFVRLVHSAVDAGRLSLRRACKLLGVRLGDFSAICQQYGLPVLYGS